MTRLDGNTFWFIVLNVFITLVVFNQLQGTWMDNFWVWGVIIGGEFFGMQYAWAQAGSEITRLKKEKKDLETSMMIGMRDRD